VHKLDQSAGLPIVVDTQISSSRCAGSGGFVSGGFCNLRFSLDGTICIAVDPRAPASGSQEPIGCVPLSANARAFLESDFGAAFREAI
jgi:hypothetical protein